ncbi:hypothetical protein A2215_04620 [Candidatus Berkelbacteria bacterium RIFOXYA2_FULL_43_10]|uniref:Uncharacterized protein n=1 Tax=Candidatus Berkelbacteria bacterium RIFOXYA2_FULL_43_10 TaxID=1797472 RepID=A0A1F5E7M0_9BACT|nr:MAG: hypothetical protein A2215_04620 [Candidatus Berkelbacteria bacterium RIFOXYA2_FULL_43_10]
MLSFISVAFTTCSGATLSVAFTTLSVVDPDLAFWNTFFEISLNWADQLKQIYDQPGLDQV